LRYEISCITDLVDSELGAAVSDLEAATTAVNAGERRRYDREFLLSLANAPESVRKPVDLPMLPDVILDMVRSYL
jgi:hypothetical protein